MQEKTPHPDQAEQVVANSGEPPVQLSHEHPETGQTIEPPEDDDLIFELDPSEEELLEEFGVLMAAEYNYGVTRLNGQSILPPDIAIDYRHGVEIPQVNKAVEQVQKSAQAAARQAETKPGKK